MKSISKYYPYVVAVALLVGLGIYSYWPSPIDVEVVTITQGPMEVTIREDGKNASARTVCRFHSHRW